MPAAADAVPNVGYSLDDADRDEVSVADKSSEELPRIVREAEPLPDGPIPGRLKRLRWISKQGDVLGEREIGSQQIPEDPFLDTKRDLYKWGLKRPPYPLEQLSWLRREHPVHGSCLEQRAADVIGGGWRFAEKELPKLPDNAPEEQKDLRERQEEARTKEARKIAAQFTGLSGSKLTMLALMYLVQDDVQTHGFGCLEIVRDDTKAHRVRQLFHMPGHTVRFHKDGKRVAQIRGRKTRFFPEYGSNLIIDKKTGKECKENDPERANEVLVFRKPSGQSELYGIPSYINAIGYIMLALASRDYNLEFFWNKREPRWLIIVTGLSEDESDEVEQTFRVDLEEAHKNLILEFEGEANVEFHKLTQDQNDASFMKLDELCDRKVMVTHRMPADRIGMTRVGPLGGNVADVANRVYLKGVVAPEQELFTHQLNAFLIGEFSLIYHELEFFEMDLTAETEDIDAASIMWKAGWSKLNEARIRGGLPALDENDERGEKFAWEVMGKLALEAPLKPSDRPLSGPESNGHEALLEGYLERLDAAIDGISGNDES